MWHPSLFMNNWKPVTVGEQTLSFMSTGNKGYMFWYLLSLCYSRRIFRIVQLHLFPFDEHIVLQLGFLYLQGIWLPALASFMWWSVLSVYCSMICLTVYLRSWAVDIHSVCAVLEKWDLVEKYNVQHVEPNTISQ